MMREKESERVKERYWEELQKERNAREREEKTKNEGKMKESMRERKWKKRKEEDTAVEGMNSVGRKLVGVQE